MRWAFARRGAYWRRRGLNRVIAVSIHIIIKRILVPQLTIGVIESDVIRISGNKSLRDINESDTSSPVLRGSAVDSHFLAVDYEWILCIYCMSLAKVFKILDMA